MSTVILYDASQSCWLHFDRPHRILQAAALEQVCPLIEEVESLVNRRGWWAAGFISYEAGPAFDSALYAHPPGELPLAWFGIYGPPRLLSHLDGLAQPGEYTLAGWRPAASLEEYNQAITVVKDYIARGHTYQVNYTIRLRSSFSGDAWALFRRLEQAQQASYAAYLDLGRFAVCCASPELFFRLDGDQLIARPMKGTARRGLTLEHDRQQAAWLSASEKNRAENVMIVDMLRNDLGKIAELGSVHVPALFALERYPTVWQMTSTVTARSQASLSQVLQALFPCASITGAPKPRTTRIIHQLEPYPRQVYTGAIGWIAPGRQAQFNVAIRTVLIDRQQGLAEYGVGGGIVWDSQASEEYAECQDKARVLTEHRPPFNLLETLRWQPGEGYLLLTAHLARLAASAEYFAYPLDMAHAHRLLDDLARTFPALPQRVRLQLTRLGEFDLRAADLPPGPSPLPPFPPAAPAAPVRICLAPEPVSSQDVFLYHKTTHRPVYDRLRRACPADCDDVLLWNERGELTETAIANLALLLDGELLTPPIESGLLAGTYRHWLLEQGLLKESLLHVDDLRRAEKIWLLNSVRGARPGELISTRMDHTYKSVLI
jgi:para-aminobenzoate synthetase/4-amino-4-deoxychorismate lyase